jgi:hypothetical protein
MIAEHLAFAARFLETNRFAATSVAPEEVLTIAPPPRLSICGSWCFMQWNTPMRLVPI